MRSFAILSQKGGCGKSTVAVHLAVAAQRAGERVVILDSDPQRSALAWGDAREDEDPAVVAIDAGNVPAALTAAGKDGFTVAIVDTAPRAEPIAAAVARAVSFVLIPLRPSAFDFATLPRTVAIVTAAKTPAALLLNACPSRAPEVTQARELCGAQPIPLAAVELGERRAYARAVQSGRSVQELEPGGAAADEIARLWAYADKRSNHHR
jgi:chromosome partitioning protein